MPYQVYTSWEQCTGKKNKIKGESDEYTLEVIKYREDNKASKFAVSQAIKIFGDSFRLTKMDNGRDLVEMVCQAYVSPKEGEPTQKSDAKSEDKEEEEEEPSTYDFGEI
eukprot:1137840-Pelagomonas_calceolata.AAC.2